MCIESEPHFLHGFLRRTNDTNESNKRTNKNFNEFILKSTQDRRMRNGNAVCLFANTLVHNERTILNVAILIHVCMQINTDFR